MEYGHGKVTKRKMTATEVRRVMRQARASLKPWLSEAERVHREAGIECWRELLLTLKGGVRV